MTAWRWLRRALALGVAVWWAGQLGGIASELYRWSWRVDLLLMALALAGWSAYTVLSAVGWWLALSRVGARAPFARGGSIWARSMLVRYVPGNVWHVVYRMRAGAELGARPEALFLATSIEQLVLVAGSAGVALALAGGRLGTVDPRLAWLPLLVPALLVGLHPRVLRAGARLGARLLRRAPITIDLSYRAALGLLGWYAGLHLLSGLAFAALARSFGVELPVATAVGAYALAYLVGYLSLATPGGIGFREAALVVLLGPDVPLALGSALALAARLLTMVAEGGIAALLTLVELRLGAGPAGDQGVASTASTAEPPDDEGLVPAGGPGP